MPENTHTTTTAAALNSFRKELIEGGFSDEEAGRLATIALDRMISMHGDALVVRDEVSA